MSHGNGDDLAASDEQRMLALAAQTAVLLIRIGRDGAVILSGDAITAGDDVRVYGLLEKCRQAVGPLCAEVQRRAGTRIMPPPPGLRL